MRLRSLRSRIVFFFVALLRRPALSGALSLTLVVPATNNELVLVRQSVEHDNVVKLQVAAGRRILLVEDEALTGMFMHDLLESFGYDVAGPFMSVEDALAAAESESICVALLDINLRGKCVDPVADVLVRRSVPFMLVTGYASDHIEERFAQVPVLRKPIAPDALRAALINLVEGRDLSFAAQEHRAS